MDPTPEPARRFLAPALVVLALALTATGAFLPLFRTDQPLGQNGLSGTARTVLFAWRTVISFPGQADISGGTAPLVGSLVLASAILVAAAVLGFREAATRQPSPAADRTTLIGAAFLAGAVCTIAMQGARHLFEESSAGARTTPLAGMWVLLAAVLAATAAAILTHRRPAARPEWADPAAAFADTKTPPSGVVITVLPPEDD